MQDKKIIGGRCDLCNGRLEIGQQVFTYWTPPTVDTIEEARAGRGYWCEDPEWGVCPTCHARVQRLDRGELSQKEFIVEQATASLENQRRQIMVITPNEEERVRLEQEQFKFVVEVCTAFACYKIPEFREEVNAGVLESGGRP